MEVTNRKAVFVRSPIGRNCKVTRRVEDFLDRHQLRHAVITVEADSPMAQEVRAAAELNGAFKNTGKQPARKKEGFPLFCVRNKDGAVTWACAQPTSDQMLKAKELLDNAA